MASAVPGGVRYAHSCSRVSTHLASLLALSLLLLATASGADGTLLDDSQPASVVAAAQLAAAVSDGVGRWPYLRGSAGPAYDAHRSSLSHVGMGGAAHAHGRSLAAAATTAAADGLVGGSGGNRKLLQRAVRDPRIPGQSVPLTTRLVCDEQCQFLCNQQSNIAVRLNYICR